jgi:hypothetical protein
MGLLPKGNNGTAVGIRAVHLNRFESNTVIRVACLKSNSKFLR